MSEKKPMVLVLAGPNGSGKSTITQYFDKIGTYTGAIVIAAANGNVKNSTTANLVIKNNTFAPTATFKGGEASNYLTTDGTTPTKGLDYNNGKAVEFDAADLFNGTNTTPKLGWFDPIGTAASATKTEQSYYHVKYKNIKWSIHSFYV